MPYTLKPDKIVGIILAGGKSSRMNTNKALLPYKNKILIDHATDLLKCVGVETIYVSGQLTGYLSVKDCVQQQGPLTGIYSVMKKLWPTTFSHAMILPVDMPLLTPACAFQLIQKSDNHDAIYYENHPLPFLLNLTEKAHDNLTSICEHETGNHSIKSFLNTLNAQKLLGADKLQSHFENINTPSQWNRISNNEDTICT